jgi:hypothetical protein
VRYDVIIHVACIDIRLPKEGMCREKQRSKELYFGALKREES